MSRIAGSSRDVAFLGFRRQWVPILSTLAATLRPLQLGENAAAGG